MAKKFNIKDIAMKVAATGAGAMGASFVEKVPFVQKQTGMIKGIAKIALGVLIPHFMGKGKKDGFIADAGAGAIAIGSLQLANATVLKTNPISISGVGEFATLGYEYGEMAQPVQTASDGTVGELATLNY